LAEKKEGKYYENNIAFSANKNKMSWLFGSKKKPLKMAVEVAEKPQNDKAVLRQIETLQQQIDLLRQQLHRDEAAGQGLAGVKDQSSVVKSEIERIIEGVFDGQGMVGADGSVYDVPANYASKSKLVEGDILKLTINNLGAFVYKQIKPIARQRLVGVLDQDPQNMQYYAVKDGKRWRLLTASVTYYKGEPGDEIIFLIPVESGSRWAAVENIINR
jgi:hypothetical protein